MYLYKNINNINNFQIVRLDQHNCFLTMIKANVFFHLVKRKTKRKKEKAANKIHKKEKELIHYNHLKQFKLNGRTNIIVHL